MTPAELRAFADKMEELQIEEMPTKVGYLKHDLYEYLGIDDFNDVYYGYMTALGAKVAVAQMKKEVAKSVVRVAKKGTKFVTDASFNNEFWHTEDYEISDMDDDWANQHLEKITEVPPTK